jgi:hypothetical protein
MEERLVNKVFICGASEWNKAVSDLLWTTLDIRCTTRDIWGERLNTKLLFRYIKHAEIVIVDLRNITPETMLIVGAAKMCDIAILGIGIEDESYAYNIVSDLCDLVIDDDEIADCITDFI